MRLRILEVWIEQKGESQKFEESRGEQQQSSRAF